MRPLWISVLLAAAPLLAAAAERDLHDYWDTRCRECHGDAGAFARRSLHVEQGRLAGTHHRAAELPRFLRNHYLNDELVAPVTAMLLAQAGTAPLFKERCGGCHATAAAFARKSLVMQGGELYGRVTRQPVAQYLRGHGGLAPAEIAPMVSTLRRVLGEVGEQKK
jgi:mono/diheme cytochrome c family protein